VIVGWVVIKLLFDVICWVIFILSFFFSRISFWFSILTRICLVSESHSILICFWCVFQRSHSIQLLLCPHIRKSPEIAGGAFCRRKAAKNGEKRPAQVSFFSSFLLVFRISLPLFRTVRGVLLFLLLKT
jgi:hypothetical protein